MNIQSRITRFNADLYTPVKLYLTLRDRYRKTCLLESNDYHSRQDSKSFIGFDPIIELSQRKDIIKVKTADAERQIEVQSEQSYADQLQTLIHEFNFSTPEFNGFFGRINFEYTLKDETHLSTPTSSLDIPLIHFFVFRYVIVIDHFTNEGLLIENSIDGQFEKSQLKDLLGAEAYTSLPFETFGSEKAEFTDEVFKDLVKKGIAHCERGDVFQLVLSNAFQQPFFGDDFQVYRQLRRLNPSPYLFFFDFEEYRLFGSSPEAQLVIKNQKAEIHPIAGTVPKTGVQSTDDIQLKFLLEDEKENAEHTMLVDLARNDLSRDCDQVNVETYKEVQHFSHVIHLVSKVTGQLRSTESIKALTHSFPAGTLSGTPKPRALELIHDYERSSRDFYGGAVGIISPDGDLNMAIVIRSILSKDNVLNYRAGAGVVIDSDPDRETREVHHKLKALRTAIAKTNELFTSKKVMS